MIAKVLKHKTLEGYHGMILHGVLYRTGDGIVPHLFPKFCDDDWIRERIKSVNKPYVDSLDDFHLVDVEIREIP